MGEAHTGTIDLVLTDIVMQGMSGWKVASALKATHPEARVLYMSGYAPDHDEMKHEAGDDASFLAKPFTPHSLRRRVRQILNGLKKAV
jgi:CheY-like chemotaxis protein